MKKLALIGAAVLFATACGAGGGAPQGATPPAQVASGTAATVKVVPHAALEALLPVLDGWTRLEPKSETDTVESVSRVTVDYEKGPSRFSVEFMDSSKRAAVLALMTEALAGKDPELKPTTFEGFPAAEQWISEVKRGSVHILVAGRFMVVVTGEYVPSLDAVRDAARKIDLQKMAALQ